MSLIVDQEANDNAPRPLPNLNFCLRVGNSLVDSFENIKLWNVKWRGSKKNQSMKGVYQTNIFNTDTVNTITENLKKAKVEFFNTSDEEHKRELIKDIERQQVELIRSELIAKGKYDLFDRINDMIKKKTKPFFIWELEFGEVFENGGFDIVIANPPYVQLQKDGGKLAEELKDQGYESFARTGDIYCIFYEKAIALLKESGVATFITSNKWMRAGYGEKLRGFLANNTNPVMLIDFGGNKVFESATVDVNILVYKKERNSGETLSCLIGDDCTKELSDYIQCNNSLNKFMISDNWTILNSLEVSIKSKIENLGLKLGEWNLSINRGLLTGYNDAFIIDGSTKDKLIKLDSKNADIIRPILRGKDIKKYSFDFHDSWIISIPCGFTNKNELNKNPVKWFESEYTSLYEYLVNIEEKLSKNRTKKSRGLYKRDDQGDYWWELRSCKYMDDFCKQNIAWQRITHENTFCLTSSNMYILDSMAFISNTKEYTNYLLAILNSSLITFWMKKNVPEYGSTGYRLSNQFVTMIPIPSSPSKNILEQFDTEVNKYFQYESNYYEIDKLVFQLYNLSKEEIDYIVNRKYINE